MVYDNSPLDENRPDTSSIGSRALMGLGMKNPNAIFDAESAEYIITPPSKDYHAVKATDRSHQTGAWI